jgi:hemoglobin
VAGGPFEYTAKDLRDAHVELRITPEVFEEVAAELGRTLDHFNVPKREKEEALSAFDAQKADVSAGSKSTAGG